LHNDTSIQGWTGLIIFLLNFVVQRDAKKKNHREV